MQHLLQITKQVQKDRCIQWFTENQSIITAVTKINFIESTNKDTAVLGFGARQDPWLNFCSLQNCSWVLKWSLLFNERGGVGPSELVPNSLYCICMSIYPRSHSIQALVLYGPLPRRVRSGKLRLTFTRTSILGCKYCRTHDHILLSHESGNCATGSLSCSPIGPPYITWAWKNHSQQFLYCCSCIHCHRNVFTKPLLNNGHLLWLHYSGFQAPCHLMNIMHIFCDL
jgi:hypothetical protein